MAPSKDTTQQPADELETLRAENARLREELAQARRAQPGRNTPAEAERAGLADAAGRTPRQVDGPDGPITVPDDVFLSEGLRVDLERDGHAIDPLTGARVGDWSKVDAAQADPNASRGPARGF